MDIKEIVLKAGYSTVPAYWLSSAVAQVYIRRRSAATAAEALIAELAKQNEPVAYATTNEEDDLTMSRLSRLKTASHGDDGKWAYDEIVSLRKQRDELLADLAEVKRSAEFNFEQYQDVGRLLHEECEKTEKLLAALGKCRKELSAWMRDHGDDIATQEAVADARAAIARVMGEQ